MPDFHRILPSVRTSCRSIRRCNIPNALSTGMNVLHQPQITPSLSKTAANPCTRIAVWQQQHCSGRRLDTAASALGPATSTVESAVHRGHAEDSRRLSGGRACNGAASDNGAATAIDEEAQGSGQEGYRQPQRRGGRDTDAASRQKRAMREALLTQLQEARERSARLQSSLRSSGPPPPRLDTAAYVDRKVYEQLAASRQQMAKQLSEKSREITSLEQRLSARDAQLRQVLEACNGVGAEIAVLQQLADSATASITFGLDRQGDQERVGALAKRLQQLQQAHAHAVGALAAWVPREVRVSWSGHAGAASEVRLMGDFDGWSRGFDLSAEDISDDVFAHFEALVLLPQGKHRVKFLVDGQWRLAPDLPQDTNESGEVNNLLVVP